MPSEPVFRFRRHFYCFTGNQSWPRSMFLSLYSGLNLNEAADSTNSTEPIHSVLEHLRESF
ncbi:hypothetical protein, partial [Neisseria meningitidis]|uniref:hypothetical protein n=1 Tax=Neisseria meningitidis TaxID=487 RepID=UPI001C866927